MDQKLKEKGTGSDGKNQIKIISNCVLSNLVEAYHIPRAPSQTTLHLFHLNRDNSDRVKAKPFTPEYGAPIYVRISSSSSIKCIVNRCHQNRRIPPDVNVVICAL